jgi:DNA recombination protein RmuC
VVAPEHSAAASVPGTLQREFRAILSAPMELILVFLAALGCGVLVGWLATRPGLTRLRAELDKTRAIYDERLRASEQGEARLREAFQALSAEALATNNRTFLDLAETRLRDARTQATADIDARKKAIEDLLAPMAKVLDEVNREIRTSEQRSIQAGAELIQRIASLGSTQQELRTETARLVDALKRPGVRGRWGELQLKRVVELAGMLEYCDFEEQQTLPADERRVRPDVIIRLPGNRRVVVDSKVPLDAYLRALEAPDEGARRSCLLDHARQVRTHITQLSAKTYAVHVQPSPDFVVMFLPGEMFFSAALEQDPALIEYGVEQHVIPASPTTLISLLRAVAYGWQQEAVAHNAQEIAELGRRLYEAVSKLAGHFERLGTRLRTAVEAYNDAIGSLESNVLVKARRFRDLQSAGGEDLAGLPAIDKIPRTLQSAELTDALAHGNVSDDEIAAL